MLDKISTIEPEGWDKEKIIAEIPKIQIEIAELIRKLAAENKRGLLIVLQGMDASGKDGLLDTLFQGVNPVWIKINGFVKPTEEEYAHDFLWRIHNVTPKKGEVGVFVRSHYEDILVPSVYGFIDKKTIDKRYEQINRFEEHLKENGIEIIKFYLHISKEKQEEKLMERVNDIRKHWKHSDSDWETREHWDKFMRVYAQIFKKCALVPWHILPTDKNWVKEYTSLIIVRDTLKKMNPKYPKLISEKFLTTTTTTTN